MKTLFKTFAILALMGLAAPAVAQITSLNTTVTVSNPVVTGSASAGASASVHSGALATAKARADQEIDRRVASLNNLVTRINAMAKIDASFKASLASTVQGQITALTNLKATIDADEGTTTLKAEIQSITKSYRIYALVLPQATIAAAADRSQTLASMFMTLGTKLNARIASSTGDTSAAVAAMADFSAKVADAQVQASAAVTHISNLQPDSGDKTTMQNNTTALKQARADIRVAQQDFVAARRDAQTVMQSLNITASASAAAGTQ